MKVLTKPLICLFLLVCFASCSDREQVFEEDPITPEEYFTGIFLLGNDLSDRIPSFSDTRSILKEQFSKNKDMEANVKLLNEQIVEFVTLKDPNYMSELKTAIERKEIHDIERVLSKGSSLLKLFSTEKILTYLDNTELLEKAEALLTEKRYDLNNSDDLALYVADLDQLVSDKDLDSFSVNPDNEKFLVVFIAVVAVVAVAAVVGETFTALHHISAVVSKTKFFTSDDILKADSNVAGEILIHEILSLNP